MKKWLRRVRGAVGMGLTWALMWAPVAVLIGLFVDPDGSMDEMWPAIGAYPGFLGGVVFSVVLAVAARRRRLEDLSLARVAAWGAGAGLLVGSLPFTIGDPTTDRPLWLLATVVIGTITLLSAVSAAGSLALARRVEKRALPGAARGVAEVAGVAPSRTWIDRQDGLETRAAAAPAVRPSSRRTFRRRPMNADSIFKRLRAAVGNALVWGAGWATLGLAVFAGLKLTGVLPASVIWPDAIIIAGRLGVMGGIAGGAFSLAIGLLYRGRRLSDLSAVRFAVGGGIVAGLFVPAFMQTMNLLSGGGMVPMPLVLDDGALAALFGAVLAGGSIKLAQRAQTQLSGTSHDQPGMLASGDTLASARGWDMRGRSAPARHGTAD